MKIGPHKIDGHRTFIIAEAGTNHLGRIEVALDYVLEAARSGADAIKFQMFVLGEELFCPLPGDDRRQGRWARSCMPFGSWQTVKEECHHRGILFLASAFQSTAVLWLKDLNVAAYKVASRAAKTYPYDMVPGPFIVSNGMGYGPGFLDGIYLQCCSAYPAPLRLARWDFDPVEWAEDGGYILGLSDHSGTVWPGLDAMARGCPMLEVHFALDKADAGPDAQVCLTVDQLKLLCDARDAFQEMRGAG